MNCRFTLTREWDEGLGTVLFVMLNPSTADDAINDPTITRCINFAKAWGYNRLEVVNTNPVRSTDPRACPMPSEALLEENDEHVLDALMVADDVVCAWGTHVDKTLEARMLHLLRVVPINHLGLTKHGYPRHPLYLAKDTRPQLWRI